MSAVTRPVPTKRLTYEEYMAEETDNRRYDILDGEKIHMPGATRPHQLYVRKFARAFEDYEATSSRGIAYTAPCDVLISQIPLRTRQPDVIFISTERDAQNPPRTDPAPLALAPELVVEVVSTNETERILNAKIADYCAVEVQEGWVARPLSQTIEVLRLSQAGFVSVRMYGLREIIQSLTFPDLTVAVEAIFAE